MDLTTTQLVESEGWTDSVGHRAEPVPDLLDDAPWAVIRNFPRTQRRKLLTSVVEAEILPRLTRFHRTAAGSRARDAQTTTKDDTKALVNLLLGQEDERALQFVDGLRQRGVTPATLYLGVVTEAARILGVLWADDRCDFVQVTLSMGRLQQILRALSEPFQMEAVHKANAETVLLVPGPGEQHTFGLLMVGEFFRREGWHLAGGPATSANDAATIVQQRWVDVAGFSIGSLSLVERLTRCIQAVRKASQNPHLLVMVGGSLVLDRPGLAARMGADGTAIDAAGAVQEASGLLGLKAAAD
jgi:MerR family transcriptional regulator, light-induced transcriptional regulator